MVHMRNDSSSSTFVEPTTIGDDGTAGDGLTDAAKGWAWPAAVCGPDRA